jgi:hypothetical protein
MSYQKITFTELKTLAENRLGNSQFWSTTEVGVYLNEALNYTPGLITATRTDQNLLNEVQYHLLETANSGASLDSDMWTITEWIDALNHRYREFIGSTELVLNRATKVQLAEDWLIDLNALDTNLLDIRRISWVDVDGVSHGLARHGPFSADGSNLADYNDYGTPSGYTIITQPQMQVKLLPAPADLGTLHIHYTSQGSDLSNTGQTILVPNDFTPYPKWGTIADLLRKEGQPHDPIRARYAEVRFLEGIAMGLAAPQYWGATRVTFNEDPLSETSLHDLDFGYHGWQGASGTPDQWFPHGLLEIGIVDSDAQGSNDVHVRGVTNAPVLTGGQYLNLPATVIPKILDYVQHIAAFKQGGQEFQATIPLLSGFFRAAEIENSKLELNAIFRRNTGQDLDSLLRPLWLTRDVKYGMEAANSQASE